MTCPFPRAPPGRSLGPNNTQSMPPAMANAARSPPALMAPRRCPSRRSAPPVLGVRPASRPVAARAVRGVVVCAGGEETRKNLDAMLGGAEAEEAPEGAEAEEEQGEKWEQKEGEMFIRREMSKEQKKKLRDEYLGLGGSANTKMSANYFLWISGFIATCAVLSKLIGAI